jgi:hypothetical protein
VTVQGIDASSGGVIATFKTLLTDGRVDVRALERAFAAATGCLRLDRPGGEPLLPMKDQMPMPLTTDGSSIGLSDRVFTPGSHVDLFRIVVATAAASSCSGSPPGPPGFGIPCARVVYRDALGWKLFERTLKVAEGNRVVLDDLYFSFPDRGGGSDDRAELAYGHREGAVLMADPDRPAFADAPFPDGSTVEVFVLPRRTPRGTAEGPWPDPCALASSGLLRLLRCAAAITGIDEGAWRKQQQDKKDA